MGGVGVRLFDYRLTTTLGLPTHLLLQHITVTILLPTLPLELTSRAEIPRPSCFELLDLSDISFLLYSWKYNLIKVSSILQFWNNRLVIDHDEIVSG